MKKIFKLLILTAVMICALSVNAFAFEENIDSYADEFSFEDVTDALSDDAIEILNQIGINEISFEAVFSVSPAKIFNALFDITKNAFENPLKLLMSAFCVIILTYIISSFSPWRETVDLVGSSVLALSVAVPFAQVVSGAFSVLESLNVFTTAFSGVFCAIVSSCSLVATAVSYTALSVFSNNLFSGLLSQISVPLVNGVCAIGFLSGFDSFGFSAALCATIKKIYIFVLSFIGTLFSGLVTLRGVLSSSADSLASKSVRFVVGRSLPIVGGAVSETYSSLIGSLSLLKNTVGVFGIITVAVLVLPTILSLLGYLVAFEIILTFSGIFNNSGICKMITVFKDVTVLLIATISITATIMVVSVGVVIAMKNGL